MNSVTVAPDWIGPLSNAELADWIIRFEAMQKDPGVRIDHAMNVATMLDVLKGERRKRRGQC